MTDTPRSNAISPVATMGAGGADLAPERADLFVANAIRDVVNEAVARYDVPSDIYERDILIDAACVCVADKVVAALSAKLEAAKAEYANDKLTIATLRTQVSALRTTCARAEAERDALDAAWSERVALLEKAISELEAKLEAALGMLQAWDDDSDHCGDDWFDDRLMRTRAFLAVRQKGGEG